MYNKPLGNILTEDGNADTKIETRICRTITRLYKRMGETSIEGLAKIHTLRSKIDWKLWRPVIVYDM